MIRKPRPLPKRFDRRTTRESRKFVRKRHKTRRTASVRMGRFRARIERRSAVVVGIIRRFAWVGMVLVAIGAVAVALFSPIFTVQEMRVIRSDARIDIEQVQRSLAPLFGRHMLLLSNREVQMLLENDVPELQDATIAKEYPDLVEVRIALQPIAARLDIVEPDEAVTTETGAIEGVERDFLTTEGLYVRYTPAQVVNASSGTYLIKLVDWGARPTPFERLIEPEFLNLLLQAQRSIEGEFQQRVTERSIYLRAQEVHLQTERFALWFDRKSTLEEQLDRYRVFLTTAGLDAAEEYVDLRLKDKVVYK